LISSFIDRAFDGACPDVNQEIGRLGVLPTASTKRSLTDLWRFLSRYKFKQI